MNDAGLTPYTLCRRGSPSGACCSCASPPIDSEDAEVRREAGLGDAPAGIDSEPEEEAAVVVLAGVDAPEGDSAEDGLQSKPRRRGRRGGRRRSAAKAKATPE